MAVFTEAAALWVRGVLLRILNGHPEQTAWLNLAYWESPQRSTQVAAFCSRYLWAGAVVYMATWVLVSLLFKSTKPAKHDQQRRAAEDKCGERRSPPRPPSAVLMVWNAIVGFVAFLAIAALVEDDSSMFLSPLFRLPTSYRPVARAVVSLVAPVTFTFFFADTLLCLVLEGAGRTTFTHFVGHLYLPLFLNFCVGTGLPAVHTLALLHLAGVAFGRTLDVASTAAFFASLSLSRREESLSAPKGGSGSGEGRAEDPSHTQKDETKHASEETGGPKTGDASSADLKTLDSDAEGGFGRATLIRCHRLLEVVQPWVTAAVCLCALYDPTTSLLPGAASMWTACKWGVGMEILLSYYSLSVYLSHYHQELRAFMFAFLMYFHVFAFVGILLLLSHPSAWRLFFEVTGFYMVGGLGITCGAHRLWAHRAYKAALPWRIAMLILNSFANQGSIYHWSRDHRVHHKNSDSVGDPYNATKGFFYCHMGWLLYKKPAEVSIAGRDIDCSDLLEDPCVLLQKKLDPWWNQFFCFVLPGLYGYYVYNSFWLGFFAHGALRWCMTLHATWTVNSVAHFWGDRPYAPQTRPSESIFTAFVAVGEGWHNWHHMYPYDYAAAEGGVFENYNPSKLVIDTGALFGLVWNRRRATTAWQRAREKRDELMRQEEEKLLQRSGADKQIIYMESIKQMFPARVYRVHTFANLAVLLRDVLLVAGLSFVAYRFLGVAALLELLAAPSPSPLLRAAQFTLLVGLSVAFAAATGTLWFALFVHATEAANGKFSSSPLLNHAVAACIQAALLVPYKPRRAGEPFEAPAIRQVRKQDEICRKEGKQPCLFDSCFRFAHLAGANCWQTSFFTCIGVFAALAWLAGSQGYLSEVLIFYVGPYLVCNAWMAYYYGLLEGGGPHDVTNEENNVNFKIAAPSALRWMRDVSDERRRTRKAHRGGLLWKWIDHLHHELPKKHLIQALTYDVSRQGLGEASRILRQRLATAPEFSTESDAELETEATRASGLEEEILLAQGDEGQLKSGDAKRKTSVLAPNEELKRREAAAALRACGC
uniref:Fatty acyl-CoA desaturase, putative n=1 Tax=Neospora caninum (strain Liverpool) TaxID=572307 RepID=A0A0F7U7A2_NEOCL|nr:TPA: fatty acyl-CoA desaturase, putative [Neospora caninum Liverpool]